MVLKSESAKKSGDMFRPQLTYFPFEYFPSRILFFYIVQIKNAHNSGINCIAHGAIDTPYIYNIVSGGDDGYARLWDTRLNSCCAALKSFRTQKPHPVTAVAFSKPTPAFSYALNRDKYLPRSEHALFLATQSRVFEFDLRYASVENPLYISYFEKHEDDISSLTISPDGRSLCVTDDSGLTTLSQLYTTPSISNLSTVSPGTFIPSSNPLPYRKLVGHTNICTSSLFGQGMVSSALNSRCFSPEWKQSLSMQMQPISTLPPPSQTSPNETSFLSSPLHFPLYTAGTDCRILAWGCDTRTPVGPISEVNTSLDSSFEKQLSSLSCKNSSSPSQMLNPPFANAMTLSADGRVIACGLGNGEIAFYSMRNTLSTGTILQTQTHNMTPLLSLGSLKGHSHSVISVDFPRFTSHSRDLSARFQVAITLLSRAMDDTDTSQMMKTSQYQGHEERRSLPKRAIHTLNWMAEGSVDDGWISADALISLGADKTVVLWGGLSTMLTQSYALSLSKAYKNAKKNAKKKKKKTDEHFAQECNTDEDRVELEIEISQWEEEMNVALAVLAAKSDENVLEYVKENQTGHFVPEIPSPNVSKLLTFDTQCIVGRFSLPEIANVGVSDRWGAYWTGDIEGTLRSYQIALQ